MTSPNRAKSNRLSLSQRTKLLSHLIQMEPMIVKDGNEFCTLLSEKLGFPVLKTHLASIRMYSPEALNKVTFTRGDKAKSSVNGLTSKVEKLEARVTELEVVIAKLRTLVDM